MIDLDDQLETLARDSRIEATRRTDVEAALTETLHRARRTGGKGRPLLLGAAAVVIVVVVAAVLVLGNDRRDTVRAVGPSEPGAATTSTVPASTTPVAPVDFWIIDEFETLSTMPIGSMWFAGVRDAFLDQWLQTGTNHAIPDVDFDHTVVLAMVLGEAENCPWTVSDLHLIGMDLRPTFRQDSRPQNCDPQLISRVHIIAVDRAELPNAFSVVIPSPNPDGDDELRLEVDLDGQDVAYRGPENTVPFERVPIGQDTPAPEPGWEITFDSIGEVSLGQRLSAEEVTVYEDGGPCGYWGPDEPSHDLDQPLSGLVNGARTSRPVVSTINVRNNSRYRTVSGVGVGTSLEDLRRAYRDSLVIDRMDPEWAPTDGLLAIYQDVAAVRYGDRALTFILRRDGTTGEDIVEAIKLSHADSWGDDEGCA